MKIVFISNYLNHHQIALCKSFISQDDVDFVFIATEQTPDFRLKLGYAEMNDKYEFVIRAYESLSQKKKAIDIVTKSDIAIVGHVSDSYILDRLSRDKLTFKYSERIFKKGRYHLLSPRNIKYKFFCNKYNNNTNYYLLCAGAYVSKDYNMMGKFIGKTIKWGYFPETDYLSFDKLFSQKREDEMSIIWVGRLIDWKHPEICVKLCKKLKDNKRKFSMSMIGDGPMKESLQSMISKYDLGDYISILGPVPSNEVKKYMQKSHIFLMTSDQNEGWGVVLNEAMDSGCVCVANYKAGAVPFLIENGKNGLVYNGSLKDLYSCVDSLFDSKAKIREISYNSYDTIKSMWNADVAARRLIVLCNRINDNKIEYYANGPCSFAFSEY